LDVWEGPGVAEEERAGRGRRFVMTLPRTPPTGISFAAFPPMLRPRIRGTEEGREGGGRLLLLLLLLLLLSLLSLLMLPLAVRHAPSTALDVTSQSPRPRKRREGERAREGGREEGKGGKDGGREGGKVGS
jgi:hypothetical protein